MEAGLLSVVIPAYNAHRSIGAAVASAFDAGATEVIVVDDGSADDTAIIARSLGATVLAQTNSGAAAARRAGVGVVSTDFVILLDSDDELLSAGVGAAVRHLRANPDLACVVGTTVATDARGRSLALSQTRSPLTTPYLLDLAYSPTPPGAVVWRATALVKALFGDQPGVWPRYAEDYELLIRGTMVGAVVSIRQATLRYAIDGGKSARSPIRSVECAELIRRHYASTVGVVLPARRRSDLRAQAAMRGASARRLRYGRTLGSALTLATAAVFSPPYVMRVLRGRRNRTDSPESPPTPA